MSLSAQQIIDAVKGMSELEKRKVLRHLASAQGITDEQVIEPAENTSVPLKKAVNGFMAFRCKLQFPKYYLRLLILDSFLFYGVPRPAAEREIRISDYALGRG